jgi:hypothetical protein
MLTEFGVRGVKIQEVFGLDEAMLSFLPYVYLCLDVIFL